MAKFHLKNQLNQENLGAVASLGILTCMIVAIMGIKLWWFKHRLSFEQTSVQNGVAGGGTPPVIVPRRSRQPRYKKDKRYSQQIYDSMEVHGVFRKKSEDELEIKRPEQLPPVRIRELSDNTSSVLLPPPRTKSRNRDQVHSTAFEDLEIAPPNTPTLPVASSSNFNVINKDDTKINLTFEEFEKQFKLKEIKSEVFETRTTSEEVIEIPVPPLRINRSSSAMEKTEKTHQHYLKSSQSITIPEFHKIIERRPTGFSRPTEDLTKIGDYEGTKLFDTFGERRLTGYIKYEEVDSDLNEQHGKEFNENMKRQEAKVLKSKENLENLQEMSVLKPVKFEHIIYNANINESANLNNKSYQINRVDVELEPNHNKNEDFASLDILPHFECSSVQDEFDNQFDSWPQFEEKIETPKVNVRKFSPQDFVPQTSVEESEYLEIKNYINKPAISFDIPENTTENNEKITYKQTKNTVHVENLPKTSDINKTEEWEQETYKIENIFNNQLLSAMTTENIKIPNSSSTHIEQCEALFASISIPNSGIENSKEEYTVTYSDDSDGNNNETMPSKQRNNVEIVELQSPKVQFEDSDLSTWEEKFTLNRRRPTGFIRPSNNEGTWNNTDLEWHDEDQVTFDECADFKDESDNWDSHIKQKRPTGYIKKFEILELSEEEDFKGSKQIKLNRNISLDGEGTSENKLKNKDIPNSLTVKFKMEEHFKDNENNQDSLIKQRRPTGFIRKHEVENLEKEVNFKSNDEETSQKDNQGNEDLGQRFLTGFRRKEESNKQENFQLNENHTVKFGNEQLRQRSPTSYVKKQELKCLEHPPPIYQPTLYNYSADFDDNLWRELEKDMEQNTSHNIEEFAEIQYSYKLNEANFLELKGNLQKSTNNNSQQPLGFGKSIEDDWENFEKLKSHNTNTAIESPQLIEKTFSDEEVTTAITTTSILKETKSDEDIQLKSRKSKVTFDFKTEECFIPATDSECVSDEDVYDKSPLPILPQPKQRLSKINYNSESLLTPIANTPTNISLFGSQISGENDKDDSWSAIRKHRNLTIEFQNLSSNFKPSSPPPEFNTPSPRYSYRNPLAQLAIKRAKEVRVDMDGFKSRSINDRKPENSKRQKQKFLNLNYDNSTEA